MAILAKETGNTNFTKAPEGVHQAVCVDAIAAFQVDRVKKDGTPYKRDEVTIIWQIGATNPDNNNKRFQVRRVFGLNLATTGHLRPFLESWRGQKFTPEDLKNGFDVEKLIGANCNLQIIHNGDWANVQGVMPLAAGQPKLEPLDYVRKSEELPTHSGTVEVMEAAMNAGVLSADEKPPF